MQYPPSPAPDAPLRITYLIEEAIHPWGGVQTVLRQADALAARGHEVLVLCKSEPPSWYRPRCEFERVDNFDCPRLRSSDIAVGTWCTTVPDTLLCENGCAVHFCQGYEGDDPQYAEQLATIERIYRLPTRKLAISGFLARRLEALYGVRAHLVPYGVHPVFEEARRESLACAVDETSRPLRIGLIGPWNVSWKDLPTGIRAVEIAARDRAITAVRVSPGPIGDDERSARTPRVDYEDHVALEIEDMQRLYCTLDVFLGTSTGGGEGFFLPAIEAMSCEVPCALSDIECFRSYGDGQTTEPYAIFVRPGDAEGFADAIDRIAKDQDLRRSLVHRGHETAARHRFEAHVDHVEAHFRELHRANTHPQLSLRSDEALLRARRRHSDRMIEAALRAFRNNAADSAHDLAAAALAMDAKNPDAWLLRARLAAVAGAFSSARTAIDKAQDLGASGAEVATLSIRISVACGDSARARSELERAAALAHPDQQVAKPCAS